MKNHIGIFASLVLACSASAALAGAGGYHLVKTVPVGGDSFWDLMALDGARHHLFITHGTHVVVVDTAGSTVAGDIPDTPQAHGVAVADDLGKGFVTAGGNNTVVVFDLATLKTTGTVTVGERPDAIAYDPSTQRVFAFNAGCDSASAIDPRTNAVAGTIALGGHPEMGVADGKGNIFLNLEDKSELLQIHAKSLSIVNRWPLAPCEGPSGMAVVDAASGKVIATPAIGDHVDSNRFDPGTGFAFSSNGDGTLTVVHEDAPDKFTVVENVATQKGARTMEVDPATHDVYLVTADLIPAQPTQDDPHPRPSIAPGSFRLLIYSR